MSSALPIGPWFCSPASELRSAVSVGDGVRAGLDLLDDYSAGSDGSDGEDSGEDDVLEGGRTTVRIFTACTLQKAACECGDEHHRECEVRGDGSAGCASGGGDGLGGHGVLLIGVLDRKSVG